MCQVVWIVFDICNYGFVENVGWGWWVVIVNGDVCNVVGIN